MKKTLVLTLAGVVGFVVLTGFRGGCGGAHHPDPARVAKMVSNHLDDALDDLHATDAQRAKAHELANPLLAQGQTLFAGQKEARREVIAQWDSATPDRAKVHALVDARVDAFRAFAHQAADAALDLHATLTPEQRAQISKKIHRHADE